MMSNMGAVERELLNIFNQPHLNKLFQGEKMRTKSHSAPLLQVMLFKDSVLVYSKAKHLEHLEHRETEGTHKDHQSPSSGPKQNHTRNHTVFLRV